MVSLADLETQLLHLEGRCLILQSEAKRGDMWSKVCYANSRNIATEFSRIFHENKDNPGQLCDNLQLFLQTHCEDVVGTALSYTAIPKDETTQFLCNIARFVVQQKKIENPSDASSLVKILMPSLSVDSLIETTDATGKRLYPDLSNVDDIASLLQTHILSSDGLSLIPIRILAEWDITQTSQEFYNPYYNYNETKMVPILNDSEKERLGAHSALTKKFIDAQKKYELLLNDKSNLLGCLRDLSARLYVNSVKALGAEYEAAVRAYAAIADFYPYYQSVKACDLVESGEEPSTETIDSIPGVSRAAYVCWKDKLYYINRQTRSCEEIAIGAMEQSQIRAMLGTAPRISLTENNDCDLVQSNSLPTSDNLASLPGSASSAYVFYGKRFFYVNKDTKECLELRRAAGIESLLAGTKKSLDPKKREEPITFIRLSREHLHSITSQTGHIHNKLQRVEYLSSFEHHHGIPEPVKEEIDKLLEIALNPHENFRQGLIQDSPGTCISIRRYFLETLIKEYEAELSDIGIVQGGMRSYLLSKAKEELEAAKQGLINALNSGEYPSEGRDTPSLSLSLCDRLHLAVSITSVSDLKWVASLSVEDILQLFSRPGIVEQFLDVIKATTTLGDFLNETSLDRVKVLLQVTYQKMQLANPRELFKFMSQLEPSRCQVVASVLKEAGVHSVYEVVARFTPNQRAVVIDELKSEITDEIIDAANLRYLLSIAFSEQCAELYDLVVQKHPDIIDSIEKLSNLFYRLPLNNCGVVYPLVQEKLQRYIQTTSDFERFFRDLDEDVRLFVYPSLEPIIISLPQSATTLNQVFAMLGDEQRASLFPKIQASIPKLITSADSFYQVLEHLSVEQQQVLVPLVDVSSFALSASDIFNTFKFLNTEQRIAVFKQIEANIPTMLHNIHDVCQVVAFLDPEQRQKVFNMVEANLSEWIHSPDDLKTLKFYFSGVSPDAYFTSLQIHRLDLVTTIQDVLDVFGHVAPEEIAARADIFIKRIDDVLSKQTSDKLYHLRMVMGYLGPEQSVTLIRKYQPEIHSGYDLGILLKAVKPEQCLVICLAIKPKIHELIPTAYALVDMLKSLEPIKQTALIAVMLEKLPKMFVDKRFLAPIFTFLTPKQCAEVLQSREMPIFKLIPTLSDLLAFLQPLSMEQCQAVFQALDRRNPQWISSLSPLGTTLSLLSDIQKAAFFPTLKKIIVEQKQSSEEIASILTQSTPLQCKEILATLQVKTPAIFTDARALKTILGILPPSLQRTEMLASLKDTLLKQLLLIEERISKDAPREEGLRVRLPLIRERITILESFEDYALLKKDLGILTKDAVAAETFRAQCAIRDEEDLLPLFAAHGNSEFFQAVQEALLEQVKKMWDNRATEEGNDFTKDILLEKYIEELSDKIMHASSNEVIESLRKDCAATIASIASPEVSDFKAYIHKLRQEDRPYNRKKTKANQLEQALCNIEPTARKTSLTGLLRPEELLTTQKLAQTTARHGVFKQPQETPGETASAKPTEPPKRPSSSGS